jgi:hypothetical protein
VTESAAPPAFSEPTSHQQHLGILMSFWDEHACVSAAMSGVKSGTRAAVLLLAAVMGVAPVALAQEPPTLTNEQILSRSLADLKNSQVSQHLDQYSSTKRTSVERHEQIAGRSILLSHQREKEVSSRTTVPALESPQVVVRQQPLIQYASLPLSFEVNQGQTDRSVRFLAHSLGHAVYLTANEVVWVLSPARKDSAASLLQMHFLAANPNPQMEGVDELPGKTNYFTSNRQESWRTNIATYAKVKYRQVYRGVDLVFHGTGRQLEFDYVVAPGASPRNIRVRFEGAERIAITEHGDLRLVTRSGEVLFRRLQSPARPVRSTRTPRSPTTSP